MTFWRICKISHPQHLTISPLDRYKAHLGHQVLPGCHTFIPLPSIPL